MELGNNIAHTCFAKCVTKYSGDGELQVGEMSCLDRCTVKYVDSLKKTVDTVTRVQQQQAEQQAMMMQMQDKLVKR